MGSPSSILGARSGHGVCGTYSAPRDQKDEGPIRHMMEMGDAGCIDAALMVVKQLRRRNTLLFPWRMAPYLSLK